MATKKSRWIQVLLVLLVLFVFAIMIAGLFAVNATAGKAFAIGIPLAFLIFLLLWLGQVLWKSGHKILIIILGALLILAANVMITLLVTNPYASVWQTIKARLFTSSEQRVMSVGFSAQARTVSRDAVKVNEYRLSMIPTSDALDSFQVSGKILLEEAGQEKPLSFTQTSEVQSVSSSQGWLLREVQVALPGRTLPQFTWKENDLTREAQNVCCFRPVTVALKELPKGAFYEASDAADIQTTAFGNTETVAWTIHDNWGDIESVRFSIVSPPFHKFPFLHRFVSLSSIADWVLTLCGMLGSSVLVALVVPVLKQMGQAKVKTSVQKVLEDTTASQKRTAGTENGVHELASYLSERLTHEQFVTLRKELDGLLKPKKRRK